MIHTKKEREAKISAAWAEVKRREAQEDAAASLLATARRAHMQALSDLADAYAAAECPFDVVYDCRGNKRTVLERVGEYLSMSA